MDKKEKLVCANCGGDNIHYTKICCFGANDHNYMGIFRYQDEEEFDYCEDCRDEVEFVTKA